MSGTARDAGFSESRLRISARRPGYSGTAIKATNPGFVSGSGSSGSGVPGTESSSITEQSPRKEDIEQAYERFRKLGMPVEITADVFGQLIIASSVPSSSSAPSVGAAILQLSKRMVGRQEAARVRGVIANAREEADAQAQLRPASKIRAPSATAGGSSSGSKKGPSSILDDPVKIASIQQDNAYRGLLGVRKEYEDARQEILDLDAERRKLEEEVKAKRRLALLLDVLTKRETARLARFGSSTGTGANLHALLSDLRQKAGVVMQEHNSLIEKLTSEVSKIMSHNEETRLQREAKVARRNAAWKYENSTEALANLHALHIRCMRSAEIKVLEHGTSVGRNVEARLDQIVDRLGIHDADEKERMKTMLIEVAQRRLARKEGICITDSDLDDMHRRLEEKQTLVQEQINRAAAIGWLCQEYIDMMMLFRTETSSALRKMLDEEHRRVDGYIDMARDALVKSQDSMVKRDQSFVDQVREAIGTGRHSYQCILEDVQKMVDTVQTSESLLHHERPDAIKADDSWAELGSEERNRRVLERKGNKIEYGFEMVQEVRTLLADSRKLKYI